MKMIETFISGVHSYYNVDEEVIYHYTESMLKEGSFVKVQPTFMDEDEVLEMIEVNVMEEDGNAHLFVLYWDKPLAPIIMRRMLKDVILYQKYKVKEDFLEFLKEMSTQYTSSEMQSIEAHRDEMKAEVSFDLATLITIEGNRKRETLNS